MIDIVDKLEQVMTWLSVKRPLFYTYILTFLGLPIRLVKVFQVAAQRFRLRPQTYQQVILRVWELIRLRIGALDLPA